MRGLVVSWWYSLYKPLVSNTPFWIICQVSRWVPLYPSENSCLLLLPIAFSWLCILCWLSQIQHLSWCYGYLLFSLQRVEVVLQWYLRLWGKTVPLGTFCHCKLPFFSNTGISPFCVCWWSFWLWVVGPLKTESVTSYLTPPQPPWYHTAFSLLSVAQPQVQEVLHLGTPFAGRSATSPCHRRKV